MPRLVISGTDTGIGKTIFSAALTHALSAHYWKPIQSGLSGETDSEIVSRLGKVPAERIIPEKWRLKTPVSPHHAALLDGVVIDPDQLTPPLHSSLVIEGAGGLLVPLTENCFYADVFARWQIPVILCARTELGTINHTILSIEAMRQRSIPIFGIAFIGNEFAETERIISQMGKVRVLGRLPFINSLSPSTLHKAFQDSFPISIFNEQVS